MAAPNWYKAFWQDLLAAIQAAWPDTTRAYRVRQIERINWQNLLDKGELKVPFVVVEMSQPQQVSGWGVSNIVYKPMPTLYYVTSEEAASVLTGATGADSGIEGKMVAMESYLQGHAFVFTLLPGTVSIDCTEQNAINADMLKANMPYIAGSVSFAAIIGYVASLARS